MMNDFYNDISKQGQKAVQEAVEYEVKMRHERIPNEYTIRLVTEKDTKIKEVKTLDAVIEEIKLFMNLDFIKEIKITKDEQTTKEKESIS